MRPARGGAVGLWRKSQVEIRREGGNRVMVRGGPGGDVLDRRARIASAALRAAYAWSVRDRERRAFGEICRMVGVVMFELGPGTGPATPTDLIAYLRQPLGGLLPVLPGD